MGERSEGESRRVADEAAALFELRAAVLEALHGRVAREAPQLVDQAFRVTADIDGNDVRVRVSVGSGWTTVKRVPVGAERGSMRDAVEEIVKDVVSSADVIVGKRERGLLSEPRFGA